MYSLAGPRARTCVRGNSGEQHGILCQGKVDRGGGRSGAQPADGRGTGRRQCGDTAAGFEEWKVGFASEAKAAGVKNKGLAALRPAREYATGTIKVDRAVNKAFSGSVEHFMRRRGAATIISKGRSLKKANAALANKIERTYGVPPGVLLAIWGMETGFGASMGKQNTVSAIVTLAYDCRRPDFFHPACHRALQLVDSGALVSAGSVGAMHGEIGHTQFLPGNVLKYGVGSKNLRDKKYALMSTANFLSGHGWSGRARAMQAIWAPSPAGIPRRVYQQAIASHGQAIDGELESSIASQTKKPGACAGLFRLSRLNAQLRLRCRGRASLRPLRRIKPSASFWS